MKGGISNEEAGVLRTLIKKNGLFHDYILILEAEEICKMLGAVT